MPKADGSGRTSDSKNVRIVQRGYAYFYRGDRSRPVPAYRTIPSPSPPHSAALPNNGYASAAFLLPSAADILDLSVITLIGLNFRPAY